MTIERKVGMGIAGQPTGPGPDVAEVFSTYLYTGNTTTQNIVNDIDLAGEGGLVWIKERDRANTQHSLFDTERGQNKWLNTASTGKSETVPAGKALTSFNSDGFSLGPSHFGTENAAQRLTSWTFRKAPKFFDVITYTGNATIRTMAHSLGSVPAMIIIKATGESRPWVVYHSSLGNTKHIFLNATTPAATADSWDNTTPTASVFSLPGHMADVNGAAQSYVAYLFADNSSELADNQMIKVGTYTGNGSATGPVVNLGWEPQWIMIKNSSYSSTASHWILIDKMRVMAVGGDDGRLYVNNSDAETNGSMVAPTSTGFNVMSGSTTVNRTNDNYIYMAIRAPMMKEPEAATDLYHTNTYTGNATQDTAVAGSFGFPPDLMLVSSLSATSNAWSTYGQMLIPRIFRGQLTPTANDGQQSSGWEAYYAFDVPNNQGWGLYGSQSGTTYLNSTTTWAASAFKRAKGFLDVVAYTGTGSGSQNVSHSLGVVPEMMWLKVRSDQDNWSVYHSSLGNTKRLILNSGGAASSANSTYFNNTTPTDSVFTVGSISNAAHTYVAYLFATLAGISKVGSYSGNGTNNHVIDCGFTAGARFILIKRSNASGDWFMYDSVRGITSTSNDGLLYLNNTQAQVTEAAATGVDAVRPHASGFQLDSDNTLNHSELDYIFYAIA